MSERHCLVIAVGLIAFLGISLFAIFGDKGYVELAHRKAVRDRILIENQRIEKQNLHLRRLIKRLRDDDRYIEWVARTELNMVRRDEIILMKP